MTVVERLEFDRLRSLVSERAGTKKGKELIEELCPLKDSSEVEKQFTLIREAMEIDTLPFYEESNLSCIISSIEIGNVLSPKELLEVADFFDFLTYLRRFFSAREGCPHLSFIIREVSDFSTEKDRVRSVIRKDGEITTEIIIELQDRLRGLKQDIRERLGEGITLRGGRYVSPMRAGQKIDGIVHDISRGGKTLFVEPTQCVSLNNEIEITTRKIEEEKERVLRELTMSLRKRLEEIKSNLDIIGGYDLIVAISSISKSKGWQIPKVGGNILRIIGGRHPILQLKRGVVPLDLEVGRDFTTLLVTGPNMGGKTVALKTLGILSLMSLSGLPIPASPDSAFPLFDNIFCDIGDESSIESGDSSFSFHLKELKVMFDNATDRSLVLVDEIDRGTEPDGGRAIASAFLEEFTRRNAITVASSHSTALKFFVAEGRGMQNARMRTKGGVPTYELKIGLPGESLWLQTADSVGIDSGILKRAEDLANKDIMKVESLLRELEEEKIRINDKKQELMERDREIRDKQEAVEHLKKKTSEELKRLQKDKKKILLEARKEVEALVREIRETHARKESIVKAKKEIGDRLKDDTQSRIEMTRKKTDDFKIGDIVRIPSIDSQGRLVDITHKKATVLLGDVKFEIPPESIECADKSHEGKKQSHHRVKFKRSRELRYETNLINLRVDEAIPELQKYIDDLWLLGERNFRIIHGVGKGILKNAVWEFLSKDSRIESFELAALEEGGDGVTVGKIRY